MIVLAVLGWWAQITPSPSDPTSFFTSIGAGAAACIALILWQRDTAKQRDRLLALEEQRGPVLVEIRDVLRTNSETLRAAAAAMHAMSESLSRVPTEAEVTRMRDALLAAERRLDDLRKER